MEIHVNVCTSQSNKSIFLKKKCNVNLLSSDHWTIFQYIFEVNVDSVEIRVSYDDDYEY